MGKISLLISLKVIGRQIRGLHQNPNWFVRENVEKFIRYDKLWLFQAEYYFLSLKSLLSKFYSYHS